MHTTTLQIHLLGDLQIRCNDGPPIQIHGDRQRSLLAYMVLHRATPQPRYTLAAHFWPESSDSQAMTNLRKVIGDLRKNFPTLDHYLALDNGVIAWQPHVHYIFDVADFERALQQATQATDEVIATKALQHAVELYRGDLLPHLYDDWILVARDRLQTGLVDALSQLSILYERQGKYADAITCRARLLRLDPLQEETYRQLMRLHALQGDLNRVKRIFRECEEVLRREFNAPPSRPTHDLYDRLLAGEATVVSSSLPVGRQQSTPLVNRRTEWRQLESAWANAKQGNPQALLILGEAGIGKSRLAEELARQVARQGAHTAYAHAPAGVQPAAYAVVTAWLRSPPLALFVRMLDQVWQKELTALLPELLIEQPDLRHLFTKDEYRSDHRLQEALLHAFRITDKPLLLVIDDWQWIDPITLDWLSLLLYQARLPLLLLCVARSEEIFTRYDLTSWRLRLRQTQRLSEIILRPFNREETAALGGLVGGLPLLPATASALYCATEGHPLLIVESLRMATLADGALLQEDTPFRPLQSPTVAATFELRLAQRSATAQKVAGLAAMIGRVFTMAQLGELWANQSELIDALEELFQAGIIREGVEDLFEFTHAALRQMAYSRLTPLRRQLYRDLLAAQAAANPGKLETGHVK